MANLYGRVEGTTLEYEERSLTIRIVSPKERPGEISFIEVTGTMNEGADKRAETFNEPLNILKILVVVDLLLSAMGDDDTALRNSGQWN